MSQGAPLFGALVACLPFKVRVVVQRLVEGDVWVLNNCKKETRLSAKQERSCVTNC